MNNCESCKRLARQLKKAVEWMEWWLSEDICECEDYSYHTCGKRERQKELKYMKEALKENTP